MVSRNNRIMSTINSAALWLNPENKSCTGAAYKKIPSASTVPIDNKVAAPVNSEKPNWFCLIRKSAPAFSSPSSSLSRFSWLPLKEATAVPTAAKNIAIRISSIITTDPQIYRPMSSMNNSFPGRNPAASPF